MGEVNLRVRDGQKNVSAKFDEKEAEMKLENEKQREAFENLSLIQYARHLFANSLVTGVPNIAEAKNRPRALFKSIVLFLCAVGFFYQSSEFVRFILTYPSVVDIQVYNMKKFLTPAYTFCNNNGVKRSKFCAKYPDRCEAPTDKKSFCRRNPHYCNRGEIDDNFTIPKPEFLDFEKNITIEEVKELGHDKEAFLVYGLQSHFYSDGRQEYLLNVSGPYVLRKDAYLILCYSAFLKVDSSEEAPETKVPSRFSEYLGVIQLDLEANETFRPGRRPGALFAAHSPFVLQNPYYKGFFIQPGRSYMVHLRMEEEDLLPYPYSSDCINYTERWLSRGKTGPRTQEACIEHCELLITFEDCNCTFPEVLYPNNGPFCDGDYRYCHYDDEFMKKMEEDFSECSAECKDDCSRVKYSYEVQQRFEPSTSLTFGDDEEESDLTTVQIFCGDTEVVKYTFRPQYQDLEVFSYIGGFMGAWMGVSLVAVIDFFESLTSLMAFTIRRFRLGSKPSNIP